MHVPESHQEANRVLLLSVHFIALCHLGQGTAMKNSAFFLAMRIHVFHTIVLDPFREKRKEELS